MNISPRIKFLIINGLKGLAWMLAILAGYFLFREIFISKNPDLWVEHFYAKPEIIYFTYIASEFMIWAFNKAGTGHYVLNVLFFSVVSYFIGYLTFLIGQFLSKRVTFQYIRMKYLKRKWPLLRRYGLFLTVVAALTPLPWSTVSLLIGSAGYPSKQFLKYALFRLVRFAFYGYIIFQTHQI